MKVIYKFNYVGRISTKYNEHMVHKTGLCELFFTGVTEIDKIDEIIKKIAPDIKIKIKELLSIKKYGRSYLLPKKWYETQSYPSDLFNFEQLNMKTHFKDDYSKHNYHFFCSITIDETFLKNYKFVEMDIE